MSTKQLNTYETQIEHCGVEYTEPPKHEKNGTTFDLHRDSLTVPYQEAADVTVIHEATGSAFPDLSKTNSVEIPSEHKAPEDITQLQDFLLQLKQEIAELEKALATD